MSWGNKWSRLLIAVVALSSTSLFGAEAPAQAETANQCIVKVVGRTADNMFIFSPEKCFATYAEVLKSAGVTNAPAAVTAATSASYLSVASIIGVHYDGSNATGASFSVSGTACNGGGFNVSVDWNDRVTSTTNGCPTIYHYANTNYAGNIGITYGAGVNTNLSSTLNNQTSSIKYFG